MSNPFELPEDSAAPETVEQNPFVLPEDNAGRLRLSLDIASQSNPEQSALAQHIARTANVPLGVVERNLPEFQRQAKLADLNPDRLTTDAPATARFLSDINAAKLAHDDVQQLAELEALMRQSSIRNAPRALYDTAGDVSISALKGAVGLPQAVVGLADIPTFGRVGKALESIGYRPAEAQKILESAFSPEMRASLARVQNADGFLETLGTVLSEPQALSNTIIESLPLMLGGAGIARGVTSGAARLLGLEVAPLTAAAIGEGAIGAGAAAEQIREQTGDGLLTGTQSATALASGVGTGLLGALGGKVAQRMGLGDIDTALAAGTLTGTPKAGFAKQVIGSGITEGLFEELPQSAQEQMWQNFALDRPILQGVANAAAIGLVAGAVTGGAFGTYNATVAKLIERSADTQAQIDQALSDAQRLQAAMGAAAQSQLRERSPETFQQLVEQIAADNEGAQSIYIDGQVLAQSGVDIAQAFPSLADQVNEAAFLNSTVEIPIAEVLTAVPGTPLEELFLQNAKSSPDALSQAEVEQAGEQGQQFIQQEAERVLQQAQEREAWQSEVDTVQQTIKGQLDQAGRFTSDVNEGYARLQSQFFSVMASRFGITPAEMYQRFSVKVAGQMGQGEVLNAQYDQGDVAVTDQVDPTTGLPLNADGTVTLYHHTSAANAEAIRQSGALRSAGEPDVYLTTRETPDTGYGDTAVKVRVDPSKLQLDDEFPDGRRDFRINVGRPGGALTGAEFNQSVSTRLPTAKKATENPLESMLVIGLDAAKADPKAFEKNVELIRQYPNFRDNKSANTPDKAAEQFIRHVVDNLLWLHDQIDPAIRARAQLWYDGANAIANRWAEKYGLTDFQISGVLAVLSPQKDWFQNVSLGERVLDIMSTKQDFVWSDEMSATAANIPALNPEDVGEITGKTLGELQSDYLQAMWVRVYDQTYNERGYRIVTPEGEFGDWVVNADGKTRSKTAWGSFNEIGKAVSIFKNGDIANISASLGEQHKVRNFYNNIFSPNSEHGDVTIDTHAVAAALLRPLSGGSTEVLHNFGSGGAASSSVFGSKGTYGIYAEAYRRAAAERGILPRQMQSITWEAVRSLFTAGFKSQEANVARIDAIWDQYRKRRISLDEARNQLFDAAGGIATFEWERPSDSAPASPWASSYTDELDPVRGADGAAGRGDRGVSPEPAAGSGVLEQQARGTFNPQTLLISLGPQSDLSTFLHESGHFFLEVMADLAAQPDAPAQVREDMGKVLGWFASGSGTAMLAKVEQDAKDAEADASRAEKAGDPDAAQKRAYADQVRSAYTFAVENGGADYMKTVAATFGRDVPKAHRIHLIRQFHERWAESFEQYLLEGKAPSAELQPLFRRFRAWLVNVYKSLTDFMRGRNLEVNDEIRQVFDRMLATDAEIAQAEEQAGLLPDFDATNAAIERLQERSLRNLKWTLNARSKFLKQFTKEAKELRKGILTEVLAEFEQRPDVMASRAIRKVRNKDGAERDAKIAAIADATGYATVEEMTAAVTALGPVNDAVEAEVDRRMLERHGDMATQEALEAAANEAVHNEARARALAAELKSQDEAMNPRETTGRTDARGRPITVNALVEAARAFGADLAARRAVGKLKNAIYLHRAAEARAGKAWQTATKKGDSKAAVQAKKDQLLNNQAVRALLDAQNEVRSAIEFFRKVTKGNNEKLVKGGRDPDVVNAMRAILGAYGIAPRTGKTALEYMELVQTNDPETAKALMPAVINAVSRNKPYTELTVEELRGLTDDLKSMWRLAKESRQIEVDGVRMSIEDAREKLYGRLEEKGIPDKVPGQTSARTAEDKAAENLRELRGNLTRVEQWSEAMDGSIGGPFNTILFRAIKVAADNYRAARAPVFKRLEEATQAVKPFIARTPINAPRLNYVFGLGDGHNNTGMAELLAALLNTGNESNKRKLLLGGRPGNPWATENPDGTLNTSNWDATIADLVADGTLRKEHFDYVQAVWDVLESLKPLAQESHRRVFGRYFSEVTAQPFVDPFGVARSGGYYPAKVDPALVPDGQLRELARQENESLEFSFPAAPSGWSKSRVENYTKPLLLDTNLVYRHIDEVLLFSHMQPSVNAVNRLLRDRKMVSALSRVSPEAYGSILTPWLAGAARQIVEEQVPSDGGFNRAASIIRSRTGLQLMMANASNTLQQITGAFTAASKLEADGMERSALIKAAAKWASNPKAFRDNVWSLSSYMRDRSENETAVLLDTMRDIMFNPTLMESAQKWSRQHGYFTQVFFDNTLSPIVWSAGYSAYLNKLPKVDTSGMSATEVQALLARQNREAVLYADALVRQTQGSNLPEDVSRFERGTGFVRLFNQFAGYFNMQANTNAASIVKLAEQGGLKKNAARGFYVLMMGLLMPIWVAEAIAVAFRGGPGDDDDDGAVWDDWLKAIFGLGTFKGLVAMVPVVGQIASAAVNRVATGSPADDRVSVSPVLSVLESAVGGNVYTGYQLATGKEVNAQRAVKDMALLIGLATGVPAYAVARPLGYAAGVAQGKIEPTGPADFARGMVTGTASPESKTP